MVVLYFSAANIEFYVDVLGFLFRLAGDLELSAFPLLFLWAHLEHVLSHVCMSTQFSVRIATSSAVSVIFAL